MSNKTSHVGEIMHLLGITENEIRWVQSQETKNTYVYNECMKHILDMIDVVQRAPVPIQLEIRNQLMDSRLPGGGICDVARTQKIKEVLESRCTKAKLPEMARNILNKNTADLKEQKNLLNRNKMVSDKKSGNQVHKTAETQDVEDYNHVWKNKCCRLKKKLPREAQNEYEENFLDNVYHENKTGNKIKNAAQKINRLLDNDVGPELADERERNPVKLGQHVRAHHSNTTIETFVPPSLSDFYKKQANAKKMFKSH